jgi:UPF0716 family protein affecting phage T7 exclusion
MRILLAILLLPLVDIASLVIVGPHLGVLGTLFMVMLSIVVGTAVLRRSGVRAIQQLRATLVDGREALPETIDAALMALAGILFILPGFASDFLALLLLLPSVRLGGAPGDLLSHALWQGRRRPRHTAAGAPEGHRCRFRRDRRPAALTPKPAQAIRLTSEPLELLELELELEEPPARAATEEVVKPSDDRIEATAAV